MTVSSKLVKKCMTSLAVSSSYFPIMVNLSGFLATAEPAETVKPMSSQERALLPKSHQEGIDQGVPLSSYTQAHDQWATRERSKRWSATTTCGVA